MKKVLVTGADGFIGSHLVEELVKNNFSVKALCLYNSLGSLGWLDTLDKEILNEIEVILGDVRDPSCTYNAISGCDIVYHLAALIAIPYSYIAPHSYIETNVIGTLNVLEAAKKINLEKIIHTSTSETYGSAQYTPINEKHPLNAQSPYAASKIAADQLCLSYWRSFNLPVTILRPFNTFGPRQSSRAVIPTIITQLASNQQKLKLGALSPLRDFNYVLDTCSAFIELGISKKSIGKVFNSSSGMEISIGDIALLISELMDIKIEIDSEEKRFRPEKSEVNRLLGDNSFLKSETNWNPKYVGQIGLRKALIETIEWFKNKKNLALYKISDFQL